MSRSFLDVDTSHTGHAYEIAASLPLDYDAVISVSGDGLVHEILNGFAHHEHPMKALATPIAPIPTGTGNGLSMNILGIDVKIQHSIRQFILLISIL